MEALKKPVGYYDDLEISVEEAISNAALQTDFSTLRI